MTLDYKIKFQQIDIMKKQVYQLKDNIEDRKQAFLTMKHVKFVDEMVLDLEQVYLSQQLDDARKVYRQNLQKELLEMEARKNQLRNVDFKYQKYY
mmetsp:Transcript_13311/g.13107  ORF Transcript_13311/g.13107 Transcript_13311/m.13107 type:complete len:95 (+) Transcript_13311:137-421(+)